MKSIPVAIVPVLNRFDLLTQLLESIDYPIDNLLIIDNSNSLENIDHVNFQEVVKVHILRMPANMGVAGSWNLGIKCYPHAPYWLFMSNDNHWLPGSLHEMNEISHSDFLTMSNVAWNTFSLGSNVVKKIGLFDENYHPAYYEDTDYMERIRLNNYTDHIKWTSINLKQISMSTTLHSDSSFGERNVFTNEENYRYFSKKIYENEEHINCIRYDLQRRINQEWIQ